MIALMQREALILSTNHMADIQDIQDGGTSYIIIILNLVCMKFVDSLEAFAMDNSWARVIVLLLGDPHRLESGK